MLSAESKIKGNKKWRDSDARIEELEGEVLNNYPYKTVKIFDDFLQQTITEADTPWIFNKGTDAQAVDPAIPATKVAGGAIQLTTGNNSGAVADDGSQIVCAIPAQATNQDLLSMEARIKMASIENVAVMVGFTDSTSLEEPFDLKGGDCTFTDSGDVVTANGHGLTNGDKVIFSAITGTTGIAIKTPYFVVTADTNTFQVSLTSGGAAITLTTDGTGTFDAITSTASDAACFVFDTSSASDKWFVCTVDSNVDDTGNAPTSIAPVADTWQKFKITIDKTGNIVKFYIDDVLVKTLTNAGVTPNVNLYATVAANAVTTASKTVDIDYINIEHAR